MPDVDPRRAGGMINQVLRHLRRILAAEMALVKLDIRAAVVSTVMAVVFCIAAVVIALVATLLLGMAVASGLIAIGMAPWAAQLITSVGFLALAGFAIWGAIRRLRRVRKLPGRVYARIVEDLEKIVHAVTVGEDHEKK